ncbi:MAG: TonB-dependent receptor [Melioribacteraceae bacterium]|nr:TonB-dependent receptor [Melioribacteraceae bacterium]
MKSKWLILFLFFIVANQFITAGGKDRTSLTGKVYDEKSSQPLEYANIVIFSKKDSSQITGTVADEKGVFRVEQIPKGEYYAKASFIGYESKIVENIIVGQTGITLDLGDILLAPDSFNFNDVVISAERAPVSYEIDKKVISVEKQLTAAGGTAVDVLENVPSITVDIEGNVSLRGSGNFQVLIDGRPTILDASEILQQTPASSIKNIEIITNPSAKYDPEGAAGIINLVMKQKEDKGLSAMIELDGGLNDKYSSNLISEYKTDSYLINAGLDYRDQVYLWDSRNESRTTVDGMNSYINSSGDGTWGRKSFGFRGGITFFLGESTSLIFGSRYGDGGFEQNSSNDFRSWSDLSFNNDEYISKINRVRKGTRFSFNTTFDHKFSNGQKVMADFQISTRDGNESTVNRLLDYYTESETSSTIVSGQRSTESGPSRDIRAKVDYTLPLEGKSKFESGVQADLDNSDDITGHYEYNSVIDDFVYQSEYSNSVNYIKNIYSAYATYSGELDDFGYQAGLRTEYTDRQVKLIGTSDKFSINRWDYFPTLHTSYKFGGGKQLMASYSKRINRPRRWELEPFETFLDAYNVRRGNPSLLPEYLDSYELGFQTMFGKSVFSIEAYYKVKDNKIERVRSVYDNNITLESVENVGSDYSFGNELMLNFDPVGGWNANLMGNIYHYRIEGRLYGEDYSRESYNWNARVNNNIKFEDLFQLQINAMYNSKSVSAQGTRSGFFMVNMAVKKDFFDKALSATLQLRNILGTANWESVYESTNFYSYNLTEREAPMVSLNLRYNFNMKPKRDRDRGDDIFDNGGDF